MCQDVSDGLGVAFVFCPLFLVDGVDDRWPVRVAAALAFPEGAGQGGFADPVRSAYAVTVRFVFDEAPQRVAEADGLAAHFWH